MYWTLQGDREKERQRVMLYKNFLRFTIYQLMSLNVQSGALSSCETVSSLRFYNSLKRQKSKITRWVIRMQRAHYTRLIIFTELTDRWISDSDVFKHFWNLYSKKKKPTDFLLIADKMLSSLFVVVVWIRIIIFNVFRS